MYLPHHVGALFLTNGLKLKNVKAVRQEVAKPQGTPL